MSGADNSSASPEDLLRHLGSSHLAEANAASAVLSMRGSRLALRSTDQRAASLTIIYARRRLLLAGFQSAHVERLRCAMNELIENLRPLGRMLVDILDIRNTHDVGFMVFRISPDGPVIGCIPLRSGHAPSPARPT